MATGTYNIGEGAAVRDASYKSCVCALLVFIAICVIILLAGTKWAKDEIDKEVDDEVKRLQLEGSDKTTTLSWYPTRTTTTPTTTSNTRSTTTTTTTTPFPATTPTTQTTTTAKSTPPTTTAKPTPPTTTAKLTPPTTTAKPTPPTTTAKPTPPTTTTTSSPFPPTTITITSPFPPAATTSTTSPFPPTTTTGTTPTTMTTATTPFPPTTTTITSPFPPAATTSTSSPFPPTTTTSTTHFSPTTTRIPTTPNKTEDTIYKLLPIFTTARTSVQSDSSYDDLGKDITTVVLPVDTETVFEVVTASKSSSERNDYIISNATSTEEITSSSTNIHQLANNETVFNTTPFDNIRDAASTKVSANNGSNDTFEEIGNGTTLETTTGSTFAGDNRSDEYILLRKLTTASTVKERSETTTDSTTTLRVERRLDRSTEKEYTTETTNLVLVQRFAESSITPSTRLKPLTAATTTAKADEGQAFIDNYNDFSESSEQVEIVTVVNKRTTRTDEKMNTTTDVHPVLKISEPVCLSVECKTAASRMLSLMNHSVDPCEDFYEFACGGMEVDNADSDTWKKLSEQLHLINKTAPPYLKTFKTFYDSCVSHEYSFDYQERISKVLELAKEVGQIHDGDPPNDVFDMTDLFAKLILRQSLPIMDVGVDIDKQSLKFIMKLTLPKKTSILKESGRWSALSEGQKRCLDEQRHELHKRSLDLTQIHQAYLECQKNYAIYLNSIELVVQALGFYSHLNDTYNQTQRMLGLRTTIEWDILEYLNELPPPNEIRKTILFKQYIVEKISDLQVHYPLLQWKRLFKMLTGHEVEDSTLVQVYFRDYFTQLFQGLQQTPYWKINNGLIAMYAQDLYENVVIPQARQHRESYCLKLSSKLFHDISSNMYMKTWPKSDMENSQKFLTKIFNILKDHLKTTLQKVDWLDDDSKVFMVTKANSLSLTFNKEEDLYNDESYLNLKYNNVDLKPSDFQYNAIKMLEIGRNMLYAIHGKPFSINYLWNYFLNSYDKSPTSFYSKSLIMAPLGMVKQPVKGFPGYITMARIGLSLAREIGRHFDPVGIQYGVTLTSESKPSYEGLQSIMENDALFNVERFVGQQEVKFKADSALSVNERVADNTGLRLISEVVNRSDFVLPWISSSFSREKIFYITVAQDYCKKTDMSEYMQQLFESEVLPASLRVENIVTNSDDFSEAFECREGSAMNNNPIKTQFPYLEKVDDYNEELENIS